MIEVLTLGGLVTGLAVWGVWAAALILLCVFIALTEGEHWGWATTMFVGIFATLGIFGVFNLWKFTLQHPLQLLYYVGMYVVAGAFWGAWKWYRFCVKSRKHYEKAKADFLKANHVTQLTPELRVEWTEKLKHQEGYGRYATVIGIPEAKNYKEKIINWMYLWPFSVLGSVVADLIIRLWDNVYKWMGNVYNNIAKAVWRGVEQDFASEEDIAQARQAAATAAKSGGNSRTRNAGQSW